MVLASAISADIKPIEKIWAILKRKVELLQPMDLDKLRLAIYKAWDEIPESMIEATIVRTFEHELRLVIENEGGHF